MKAQNAKLRKEFEELKEKLNNCLSKVSSKPQVEQKQEDTLREQEVRIAAQRIEHYKRQIELIKGQLETTFNIDKLALADA